MYKMWLGFMVTYLALTLLFIWIAVINRNHQDKEFKGELIGSYFALMFILIITHVVLTILGVCTIEGAT